MRVVLLLLGAILLTSPQWVAREPARVTPAAERLTAEEMAQMVGGGSCKGCRFAGARLDECYHAGFVDPCLASKCIENEVIEDTCDPGEGTCTGFLTNDIPWEIQYVHADSGCTTSKPTGWTTWFTHYYGADCATSVGKVRCQKTNGLCAGTVIDSCSRYPGIVCQ